MSMPWREAALLARYHARILNRWLLGLMLLGFVGLAVLSRNPDLRAEVRWFALEPYPGLLAAMLGSSLLVGDPVLEVILATRAGGTGVLVGRFALSVALLALYSAGFLAIAAPPERPLVLLVLWLAPVAFSALLGVFGTLSTRSPALGLTLALLPLAVSLFAAAPLLGWRGARWFLVTYTYAAGLDAPDWWINRLVLLSLALILAVGSGWLLRRDEHLLGG